MERFFEAFQPGFHSYHPFRLNNSSSENRPTLQSLQEWCKYTILQLITLRNVKREQDSLRLPRALTHYLQTFTTNDFIEVESAPFVDILNFSFYHRALTYRVHCKFDGCEYLATHGSNQTDHVDATKLKEKEDWINTSHDNLMTIYGVVLDELTGNVFYIMTVPHVSLEHIQMMLFSSSLQVPEIELWALVHQLSKVLLYIQSCGLHYGSFGLDNVFMVDNQIVLENELTRKSRFGENLWSRIYQSSWHSNSSTNSNHVNLSKSQLNEVQSIWYLGFIISKFASTYAGSPLTSIDIPQNFVFYKRCMAFDSYKTYSHELCQLIIDTQNPDFSEKPTLVQIRDLATDMVRKLKGLNGDGDELIKIRSSLLELAKREFEMRKQTYWR